MWCIMEFWKIISGNCRKHDPLSVDVLACHFQQLHSAETSPVVNFPITVVHDAVLDEDICEKEVLAAIRLLKQNTSPGLDYLPPALFKLFQRNNII